MCAGKRKREENSRQAVYQRKYIEIYSFGAASVTCFHSEKKLLFSFVRVKESNSASS